MRTVMRSAVAILLLLAPPAKAQENPAEAPPLSVALAPLESVTGSTRRLDKVEELVEKGLAAVPGFRLITAGETKKAVQQSGKSELKVCEGEDDCLTEMGKLVGADWVVAGDVSELGDGYVCYLKVVNVKTGKEVGSTTAIFGEDKVLWDREARAAGYRLLAPRRYRGLLELDIDVPGAVVYIDGQKIAKSPTPPLQVTVGTHALRITHEQYRDYVRFVDITFDETTRLDVGLKAFPIITDEMRRRRAQQQAPVGPVEPRPWYREWWAPVAGGVVLVTATTLIVHALSGGIESDREEVVGGP